MKKYYSNKEASKILSIHPNTLRIWEKEGKIIAFRTDSGQRRYDVDEYLKINKNMEEICYCRVSSAKQQDDLVRQIDFMKERFPKSIIVKDIGSGLNFKRKGLQSIIEKAIDGNSIKLMVAHKDRLSRFGFELIKFIVEKSGGEIIVLDQTSYSPEVELTRDLLNILHVFSCRMNGLRNYKKKISQDYVK